MVKGGLLCEQWVGSILFFMPIAVFSRTGGRCWDFVWRVELSRRKWGLPLSTRDEAGQMWLGVNRGNHHG